MAFHLHAFELIFVVLDEFCHSSTQIKSLSMTNFLFSSNFYLRFSCSNYSSQIKLQQGLVIAQKEFLNVASLVNILINVSYSYSHF